MNLADKMNLAGLTGVTDFRGKPEEERNTNLTKETGTEVLRSINDKECNGS